jgi:cell wall-associated NlpC family hydrolase
MSKVSELIDFCRGYLGVPWKHQGRTTKGVDCVGFLLLGFKHIGVPINELKGYGRVPDGKKLKEVMDTQPYLESLPTNSEIQVGDILLFKIRKHPQHVGLVTSLNGKLGMIHAYNGGSKKVVEHSLADYWKNKIVGIYRIK